MEYIWYVNCYRTSYFKILNFIHNSEGSDLIIVESCFDPIL